MNSPKTARLLSRSPTNSGPKRAKSPKNRRQTGQKHGKTGLAFTRVCLKLPRSMCARGAPTLARERLENSNSSPGSSASSTWLQFHRAENHVE